MKIVQAKFLKRYIWQRISSPILTLQMPYILCISQAVIHNQEKYLIYLRGVIGLHDRQLAVYHQVNKINKINKLNLMAWK